jgi:RNA polymerase sigma-70 factor (ECF subfamily)
MEEFQQFLHFFLIACDYFILAANNSIMSIKPDRDEFLQLLDQHKKIIFKICNTYCKNIESRKDLAQEIVIHLWKSYGRYNAHYKMSTWIYRIALNVAISFYRRERKNIHHTSLSDDGVDLAEEVDNKNEVEANITLLHRFIGELDELHKALMILYLDNNRYREIGEVLGITETNVATKINRIKLKLKQQFEIVNKQQHEY